MKNTISTEFKNSTSYNLVKINNVDRDVRIVEESSIIKNPNKKRLLCYPDENISIGDIVLWDSENWICTETDTTSQVSDVGIISKSNNTLTIYKNNTSYQIPCIISKSLSLNTEDNQYIKTVDNELFLTVSSTTLTQQIKVNDIYEIGIYNYYISSVADDISNPGLLIFKMKYSEVEQEEHVYTIEILNGETIDLQQGTILQLNINIYDNQILVFPLPSLIFTSNNELIANVDENGLVTVYNVIDNCNITVSLASDSSISKGININVIEAPQDNITYELLGSVDIIKGYSQIYTAKKYLNGILVEGVEFTFSIIPGSTPTSAYTLNIIDGDQCSITANLFTYYITLRAVDDGNGEIVEKSIKLKNLF